MEKATENNSRCKTRPDQMTQICDARDLFVIYQSHGNGI